MAEKVFTPRDAEVLRHVARYRVTTQSVLSRLFCGGSDGDARKLVSRLSEHVSSGKLYGNVRYYQLKPGTAKAFGVPQEAGKPLGPQALPTAIGILGFCCGNVETRHRYTRPDFTEDFPELVEPLGVARRYYLDLHLEPVSEKLARLSQIVVDLDSDVSNLVEKLRERMREHLERPVVKELVLNGLFGFSVVVSEPEKKRSLDEVIARKPLKMPVHVAVVEELGRLPKGSDAG